jgi:hypothetical protein
MKDGWYMQLHTKHKPTIHWIENDKILGCIDVKMQIKMGSVFEPVHVFTEVELDAMIETARSAGYHQGVSSKDARILWQNDMAGIDD